jgi:quinol monooxygenase YgiN
MAGAVHVPWYATGLRADALEAALAEIAPVALRYGASEYSVYRSRDDAYRFTQYAKFADKADFERYWYGEEFSIWRADYSSWYQVPVVYQWADMLIRGGVGELEQIIPVPAEPS